MFLFLGSNVFDDNFVKKNNHELTYSKFIEDVKSGDIKDVLIRNNTSKIAGHLSNGDLFTCVTPSYDPKMMETLIENHVNVMVDSGETGWGFIINMLAPWLPMILIIAFLAFSSRQIQGGRGGTGGPLGLGKSKARMFQEKNISVTFDDVAGIDEAKAELEEIVDFLKNPQKFQRLGGKIPRGVLLVGAPGNGKTLLARAIAGEAKVPFFSISGSDFVEVFVGVGASRVRDMFEHAKKNSPCIIFIDEIDAVGRRRDSGSRGGGNEEREQTLNQLLVEMDGFEENQGVIVLAATNRADILDSALLRPGRFDRRITVQYPDMNGREKILKVHVKNVPLSTDVDLKNIARGTPGFSGAELANLVNEAALLAAKSNKLSVSMTDFEMAKDKVLMGYERKSMIMTEDEKKSTAYHEAGHALVALIVPSSDPIHKVTIIPRGGALGMVMRLPEKDKISVSREELLSDIKVAMGGRVAEELIFGYDKVTTGASQDIKSATNIAKNMIINWGMSDKLGFRNFYGSGQDGFFMEASDNISQKTSEIIDKEINDILTKCYDEVVEIVKNNRKKLDDIVENLMLYETLTGDEVRRIFNGEKIIKSENDDDNKSSSEFLLGGLPNSEISKN